MIVPLIAVKADVQQRPTFLPPCLTGDSEARGPTGSRGLQIDPYVNVHV